MTRSESLKRAKRAYIDITQEDVDKAQDIHYRSPAFYAIERLFGFNKLSPRYLCAVAGFGDSFELVIYFSQPLLDSLENAAFRTGRYRVYIGPWNPRFPHV